VLLAGWTVWCDLSLGVLTPAVQEHMTVVLKGIWEPRCSERSSPLPKRTQHEAFRRAGYTSVAWSGNKVPGKEELRD
jgi:hypothetical protein